MGRHVEDILGKLDGLATATITKSLWNKQIANMIWRQEQILEMMVISGETAIPTPSDQ